MSYRGLARLGSVAAICFAATTLEAWAQIEVGRHETVRIDSAKNYPGAGRRAEGLVWTEELRRPGASYLALHFSEFDLTPGDYLEVSDGTGGQSYRLEGRGKRAAGTFWARHVKGDTVRLELHARSRHGGPGFVIDELAVGFSGESVRATEAICGIDDKENAVCYQGSHPSEYSQARPVARLLIGGSRLCTGWLASSSGDLLTNAHCIDTDLEALNTDYEFMAETPSCRDANCQLCYGGEVFSGGTLVRANTNLDYALVQVYGNPALQYGFLEIDDRAPVVGERVYIPQHPGGRAKEIAVFSSDPTDPGGSCSVATASAAPCFGSGYSDIGYACDTEAGSSGAPVLAASSHRVIALHHCATCPNRAVPMRLVLADIGDALGSSCASDADCDDRQYCTGVESCVDGTCRRSQPPCFGLRCDEPTDACLPLCNADGVCDGAEDCTNCPEDCVSGTIYHSTCGNDVCEISGGETCLNCPEDCNSTSTGTTTRAMCCGLTAVCTDAVCTDRGNTCTMGSSYAEQYCCGDNRCAGGECFANCQLDCPTSGCNNNGSCDTGESCYNCPDDCHGRTSGKRDYRYCCGNRVREKPETFALCNGNF